MDIIFLGGLEIETIIGIYDWEREIKQTVVLDIEMAFDIQKAAETDDIFLNLVLALVVFFEGCHLLSIQSSHKCV